MSNIIKKKIKKKVGQQKKNSKIFFPRNPRNVNEQF